VGLEFHFFRDNISVFKPTTFSRQIFDSCIAKQRGCNGLETQRHRIKKLFIIERDQKWQLSDSSNLDTREEDHYVTWQSRWCPASGTNECLLTILRFREVTVVGWMKETSWISWIKDKMFIEHCQHKTYCKSEVIRLFWSCQ